MSGLSDPDPTGGHQPDPANDEPKHLLAWIFGWEGWDRVGRVLEVLGSFGALVVAVFALYVASDSQDIHNAINNLSDVAKQTRRQADAATTVAKETHDNFIADERPWLKIDPEIRFDVVIQPNSGVVVLMNFRLKNTGKTPAFFVTPTSNSDDISGRDIAVWQEKACVDFKATKAIPTSVAETVFPGQEIDFPMHAQMTADQISRIVAWRQNRATNSKYVAGFTPAIFGCINYRSAIDDVWHQTWFVYSIEPMRGGPRSASFQLPRL